jgi:hypothetical protein
MGVYFSLRHVEQFASGKGLLNCIRATEAFNKGMPGGRRQEYYYFAHLHLFPNLVRESKHGSREVPTRNDLKVRLIRGWKSSGRTYD